MSHQNREYFIEIEQNGTSAVVPVKEFDLLSYACGLNAGEHLRLKDDLPIEDATGRVTGKIPKGSIWHVLSGASIDPGCLWLEEQSSGLHSWEDDESIFGVFERC